MEQQRSNMSWLFESAVEKQVFYSMLVCSIVSCLRELFSLWRERCLLHCTILVPKRNSSSHILNFDDCTKERWRQLSHLGDRMQASAVAFALTVAAFVNAYPFVIDVPTHCASLGVLRPFGDVCGGVGAALVVAVFRAAIAGLPTALYHHYTLVDCNACPGGGCDVRSLSSFVKEQTRGFLVSVCTLLSTVVVGVWVTGVTRGYVQG